MKSHEEQLIFDHPSPRDTPESPAAESFLPSAPCSQHDNPIPNTWQPNEPNPLQPPYSRSAQLAEYPGNSHVQELSTESSPGNEPTHFYVHERPGGRLSRAQIAETRLRYDAGVSAAARCTGITPSELSNLEHADGHDVAGGSLTYEQISSPELQAAYGTVASAATEQANMGVVIADVALIGYEDGNGDDDDDASMTDAGYESDASTTGSTSITPSIWDHSFENGRRYHKFHEGAYHFPNDDAEQEREDMKHSMVKMLCNDQLHFAPIGPSPQAILDIGTGTGSWAMEMGERYPSASVLGVDLSPIQPDWVPPNVRFMVDDVESPWLHPRDHFDYIHFRHTVMAIKDWDILLRRCYEHTKPGGWVELQEIHHFPMSNNGNGNGSHAGGGMMPPDHPVAQYWRRIDEGLARLGVVGFGQRASEPWSESGSGSESTALELLRGAGFVEATGRRVFHIPIGPWPRNKVLKGVGVYWRTILVDGLQATALRPLMRGLRWERARVEAFLVAVRRAYLDLDLDDNEGSQMYMPLVCVYGQKPLNGRLLS